jgi:3-phenylpropionate/trans-cinnamate dioxygenase ferredoxin subunit
VNDREQGKKNAEEEVEQLSFVKVAETSEIPSGEMKAIKFEEKEILVANAGGSYYAMGNRCTHAGADLSKGTLDGTTVTCPKHGSKFDITTGKVVSGPKVLFMHPKINDETSYELRVEGKDIMLKSMRAIT